MTLQTNDFKPGDRVRLVDAEGASAVRGATGTITAYQMPPGSRLVDVHWDGSIMGIDGGYYPWRLEKIPAHRKLKVGDRVRVTGKGRSSRGAEGVVIGQSSGLYDWRVRLDPDSMWPAGTTLLYADDDLTQIDKPFKLSPGDKIRNVKTGRVGRVGMTGLAFEGQVYEVGMALYSAMLASCVPVAAIEEYEAHYPGTYEIVPEPPEKEPF